jgi:hypothetical protein
MVFFGGGAVFWKITEVDESVGPLFPNKMFTIILTKINLAAFGVIFSRTHPVPLIHN